MTIVVSKNNKNAKRLEESNFRIESDLQKYIYDNPDVVPIYDINQDAQLFIAAREFPTNSGPIDALGFDESGNIYVIETKLFKNQDKRTVVAQALDYGASLWRYSTDFDVFVDKLNSHTIKQFSKSFEKSFCEFFGLDDFSQASDAIHRNLENGIIKFVILMDELDDRLKDLIVYVNQNSKFDIYAVDFEYYKHDQFEIGRKLEELRLTGARLRYMAHLVLYSPGDSTALFSRFRSMVTRPLVTNVLTDSLMKQGD